jgi:hypothetical protein
MHEKSYIAGNRAAIVGVVAHCLRELGYEEGDNETKYLSLLTEREQAIAALREVCEEVGDNDWEDDLHLADIINKHLLPYLYPQTTLKSISQIETNGHRLKFFIGRQNTTGSYWQCSKCKKHWSGTNNLIALDDIECEEEKR